MANNSRFHPSLTMKTVRKHAKKGKENGIAKAGLGDSSEETDIAPEDVQGIMQNCGKSVRMKVLKRVFGVGKRKTPQRFERIKAIVSNLCALDTSQGTEKQVGVRTFGRF